MKIAGSFLKIQNDLEKIKILENSVDQIHFDVMDGIFTENKTLELNDIEFKKDIDVHLMVKDVKKYVDKLIRFNPKYISFHYEATDDILDNINYIKEKNSKVGIAINPDTKVEEIYKYLDKIDLVLLLSVVPGKGGQKFIDISDKLDKLYNYRKENNLSFLIEVDGGINDDTVKKILKADIAVVGSFITDSSDYKSQVKFLKKSFAFTLLEVLGVIIILGIIGMISFVAVDRYLVNSRIKTCKVQEKNIVEAAKMYFIDNPRQTEVTIQYLDSYLPDDFKNPMTGESYNNNTIVKREKIDEKTKYSVTYADGDKGCE